MLSNFVPQLTADFQRHGGIKIHVSALCLFYKAGGISSTFWVTSYMHRITHLHGNELQQNLADLQDEMRELIENLQMRCLESELREDQQQHATFAGFRTHLHQVSTMMMSKVGLCAYDNKRYLLDAVNSLSYGHYKIAEMAEPEPECE